MPATYLIVLRQVLVASDLAETIAQYDPSATILTARRDGEALALLEGVASVAVAFLGLDPAKLAGSPLGRAVTARGARVVLLGEAAETAAPSPAWEVLHRPFTSQVVLRHLRSR